MNELDGNANESLVGKRVLVVDDHRNIRVSLKFALEQEGACVTEAESKAAASAEIDKSHENAEIFDLYLLDMRLGDGSGIEVLRHLVELGQANSAIMISGEGTVTEALQAINLGAFDFIEKPFTPERIIVTSKRCADYNSMRNRYLLRQEFIGKHPSIVALNSLINKVARTNSRVLVYGETGTGKEMVAKLLHRRSGRANKPLVKVNCAAIPHSLIESELFGHEKGAFTGALKSRIGLFEQADGGTLFLDEIGELELDVQAKLLRVLETGEINRVGSEKTISVDVRIFAATHRDLALLVKNSEFREDLYYRLNVVSLSIPPLRDRGDDILLLAKHYLIAACEEHSLGRRSFSETICKQICAHKWPGNIRELKNYVERMAILSESEVIEVGDDLLTSSLISAHDSDNSAKIGTQENKLEGAFQFACDALSWETFHDQIDRAFVSFILRQAEGNVSEASRILNLERAYLHRLMKKLGITRDFVID